jgi:hypothetical protein
MLGIARERDAETKNLRSDQTRARRRLSWAWGALTMLQNGVDPATIIDPDTKRPVAPGPHASPAPEPTRAAAPPPPAPAPPPAEASPPVPSIPTLPEGCSAEAKEMWLIAAGAVLSKKVMASPADEPEPPPTA